MSASEKLIKGCVAIHRTAKKPPAGEIMYLHAVF
jgi:hypothetical protein